MGKFDHAWAQLVCRMLKMRSFVTGVGGGENTAG
jgi:hypothetical protein